MQRVAVGLMYDRGAAAEVAAVAFGERLGLPREAVVGVTAGKLKEPLQIIWGPEPRPRVVSLFETVFGRAHG